MSNKNFRNAGFFYGRTAAGITQIFSGLSITNIKSSYLPLSSCDVLSLCPSVFL